ncbi:hypothetical protein ACQ4M4_12020 [Leptolyngbya sp. AN02str]|uniref:hypothetical protein n=1 Tax=Leptolyngbya sp. AN02str TaxID=3423363 RepID=UPI003D318E31
MDVIAVSLMVFAFLLSSIRTPPPPKKTPEKEIAEAIAKYLGTGISVVVKTDKAGSKDIP